VGTQVKEAGKGAWREIPEERKGADVLQGEGMLEQKAREEMAWCVRGSKG